MDCAIASPHSRATNVNAISIPADTPAAIVTTAPVLGGFGAIGINRNTEHPYATALFVDWMLSDEAQQYLSDQLRGPVTLKHPYLPDDVQIANMPELPKAISSGFALAAAR